MRQGRCSSSSLGMLRSGFPAQRGQGVLLCDRYTNFELLIRSRCDPVDRSAQADHGAGEADEVVNVEAAFQALGRAVDLMEQAESLLDT